MRRSSINVYDDPEQHHSDSLLLPTSPNTKGSMKKLGTSTLSYAQRVPGRLLKYSKRKGLGIDSSLSSSSSKNGEKGKKVSTSVLVAAWYIIGVISISTSKILLTDYLSWPFLSIQQFAIGQMLLRQFIDLPAEDAKIASSRGLYENKNLVLCGIFFSSGFVLTNLSFSFSSAPVVETVKSAEPITSTFIAVLGKVDSITISEVGSLLLLMSGVSMSTVSNDSSTFDLTTFGVVMLSNLAFSMRGLYQKRMPKFSSTAHLQFHLQRIGFLLFCIPFGLYSTLNMLSVKSLSFESIITFLFLSILNGVAFASYNFASTSVLQRLSVVQHASLNSLRRVFAIVVTSFFFNVTLTTQKIIGILLSVVGFALYCVLRERRNSSNLNVQRLTGLLPSVVELSNSDRDL